MQTFNFFGLKDDIETVIGTGGISILYLGRPEVDSNRNREREGEEAEMSLSEALARLSAALNVHMMTQ